jgi:hypothetical protein
MSARIPSALSSPHARNVALAICIAWLLFQNSLLVLWLSSQHLQPWFVAARALVKVGAHLFANLWMLPAAAALGAALAISSGERQSRSKDSHEVSHA